MILIALALATDTPPFDIKNIAALRQQRCSTEFPDDFTMQEVCVRAEIEGMAQFKAASDSIGRPLDRALEHCVSEFTEKGVPDFTMIGTCARLQAESYRKLHPGS